jgi:hypothetical protein
VGPNYIQFSGRKNQSSMHLYATLNYGKNIVQWYYGLGIFIHEAIGTTTNSKLAEIDEFLMYILYIIVISLLYKPV